MSIQKQWSDFHLCDVCTKSFDSSTHIPFTLVCGHTFCKKCLSKLKSRQCPHDKNVAIPDLSDMLANYAIVNLLDHTELEIPASVIKLLEANGDDVQVFKKVLGLMEELALFLKPLLENGLQNLNTAYLTRPMLKKLVTLINSQLLEVEGRARVLKTARSLAERSITELLIIHQGQQQLSHQLWAAIRNRGCQFLGPVMQEETLKYIQKVLDGGQFLSRKNIVYYVVEQLEKQFPQASRTSVGHVVQLLYRSSCFIVDKRDGDSSLMQLKEEYRNHDALRKEHDTQIVRIAMEAGLRIGPEQWSSLLYGDQKHKSHMQSIIDKLIAIGCASTGVNELVIALERAQDPYNLSELVQPLEQLLLKKLELPTGNEVEVTDKSSLYSLTSCTGSLEALLSVISQFVNFMKQKQNSSSNESHGGLPTPQTLSSKYKTGLCRDLQRPGGCPRGNSCTYAHSQDELDKHRAAPGGQRKGKQFDVISSTVKPKTGPLLYPKQPAPPTGSLPINHHGNTTTTSYHYPYSSNPQYSGEHNPSPPTTGTFPLSQEQPVRSKGLAPPDMYGYDTFKDGGTMYTGGLGSGYTGEVLGTYQQRTSLSALRSKRENIKRMMQGEDEIEQDEPLHHQPSSLPSSLPTEHQFLLMKDRQTDLSSHSSGHSDEDDTTGVGGELLTKTRSFPDLSSKEAYFQQQLAIKEARLKKQEQDLHQREMDLQWQTTRSYPRQYSGEQQPLPQRYYHNWSGSVAPSYPPPPPATSQPSTANTYAYRHPHHPSNDQRWSRPQASLSRELAQLTLQDSTPLMVPSYDPSSEDAMIAQVVANHEQQKFHHPAGYGMAGGYNPPFSYPTPSYGSSSGYTLVQKFQ